jgi:protein-S-isoprenylcysteine O-methyltransferase Ste14
MVRFEFRQTALAHVLVSLLETIFLAWYCLLHRPTRGQMLGLLLAAAAFLLWATARLQLGKSFSIRPRATALVTCGVYSKIRNPIYVFSALWIAGLLLALGKPWGLLILLAIAPTQMIRARRETRLLEEKFGDAYRTYRRNTWF